MLTFEEFVKEESYGFSAHPKYLNFLAYFTENEKSKSYRKYPIFQKFIDTNPDLEKKLREIISPMFEKGDIHIKLEEDVEKDLYKAYKIMLEMGATDKELLG